MSNTDDSYPFGNLVRYMFDRVLRFLVFRDFYKVKVTHDVEGKPVEDDGLSTVRRCESYVFDEGSASVDNIEITSDVGKRATT